MDFFFFLAMKYGESAQNKLQASIILIMEIWFFIKKMFFSCLSSSSFLLFLQSYEIPKMIRAKFYSPLVCMCVCVCVGFEST
jgi:hypothetical protein